MSTVFAVQILIVLSFIFSLRMRVWRTSVNSFVFISALFVLTISREFAFFQSFWVNYHTSVMGAALVFVMGRLSYQSFRKKCKDWMCSDCTNYNRREGDSKNA